VPKGILLKAQIGHITIPPFLCRTAGKAAPSHPKPAVHSSPAALHAPPQLPAVPQSWFVQESARLSPTRPNLFSRVLPAFPMRLFVPFCFVRESAGPRLWILPRTAASPAAPARRKNCFFQTLPCFPLFFRPFFALLFKELLVCSSQSRNLPQT